MNNKIVVVISNDNIGVSAKDSIYAVKEAGFENVFVQWYDKDFSISQLQQVQLCQQLGLHIEFAHLGYQGLNNIWLDNSEYDAFVQRYKKDILDLHNLGIDMVVMHLTGKFFGPSPNEVGLKRFQEIVDYAQTLGVKVAFENTKLLNHMDYTFDHIKNENVGLCFDVGHYHCNNKDNWDISKLKNRVLAVHLHDNDASADQHRLPFDGTINWPKMLKMLNDANYQGPIILEVMYGKDYQNMSLVDFYKEAYKRAKALIELNK